MQSDIQKQFADIRQLFPHAGKIAYFNSASYGPFSTRVQEAIDQNIDVRMTAEHDDSHDAMNVADALRSDYAGLIGAQSKQVGIGLNTSFGINIAAFGLPLKPGDEILVCDIEFPAGVYAWRAAAEARGLKLKFVKSVDRMFSVDEFKKSIGPRSRVLSLSWVQFFNGFKVDLEELAAICKQHDMYFVVDGIQGMGAEPIDVRALDIDIFSSGCQKWMLAPQGCGFFYLSDKVRDTITPPFMSWLGCDWQMNFTDLFHYDRPYFDEARRFELGYYAVLNLHGMKASVEIFKELGIDNIQKHNHALIDRLAAYIQGNPFYKITSSMEPKHRSSIFTFTCDDVKSLHRAILSEKIILASREGSVRVAAHLFNDDTDIDRLTAVLEHFSR